jgi:hypothetical protein
MRKSNLDLLIASGISELALRVGEKLSGPNMIPVNEPILDGNEKRYLAECIESGWISSEGPFVRRLEKEFALRVNRNHGIAVSLLPPIGSRTVFLPHNSFPV